MYIRALTKWEELYPSLNRGANQSGQENKVENWVFQSANGIKNEQFSNV